MKAFITSIILFISASIFLSSCGSKLSLTKRHYRNGYYVSNTNKQSTHKIKDDKKITINKPVIAEPIIEERVYAETIINDETFSSDVNKNYSTNNEIKKTSDNYFKKNITKQVTKTSPSFVIKKNKLHFQKLIKSKHDGDDKDGLSLFWIIIIIVLILWAFGYLAFALGAFIHLLLLIALVLLILWLLRII
jgi:major membrane immunogen (membrane-anchored lipoprotein)